MTKPTLLTVAQIYESTLLSADAYAESLPTLMWLLSNGEESKAMLEELHRQRDGAPSLMDLARLILCVGDDRLENCYDAALWAVAQTQEGRDVHADLQRLGDDTGDVLDVRRWPVQVLQRHREVDTMLASDDWTDPADLVDPARDNVTGEAYRQWTAICVARQKRCADGADQARLQVTIDKIRKAGKRQSTIGNALEQYRAIEPALRELLRVSGLVKLASTVEVTPEAP